MKSEVYIRSQLEEIVRGLIVAAEHFPELANNDAASIYYAGYYAGLRAFATSVSIALPERINMPKSSAALLEVQR